MTSETKNTAPTQKVASETSQGTGFSFLLSQDIQRAKHQRCFEAPAGISMFSVHQQYGISQSENFVQFSFFGTVLS